MNITGTIDSIWSKTKTSKAGKPFNVWYCSVDGESINLGFKAEISGRPVSEGEYLDVTVEKKYGEWQVQSGSVGGTPPATPAPKAAPPAKSGGGGWKKGGGTFPVSPTDSQVSIIRQSSLNRAVDVMGQLLSNGVVKVKNEEEYREKLFELAYDFTDFGTGQREIKKVEEMQALEAAKAAAKAAAA